MSEMPDERLQLIYAEALRGLAQQADSLDELRTRAGTILSAASIAAGFLAGGAIVAHKQVTASTWIGISGFVVSSVFAILVLAPRGLNWIRKKENRRQWSFVNSPTAMLNRYVRGSNPFQVNTMYEELAEDIERSFDENQGLLDGLGRMVLLSCVFLLVEIAGFLLNLRG